MKTKNYELYFNFFCDLYDWAAPLRFSAEYLSKDYTEVWLQILCFNVGFTSISDKYSAEVDKMYGGGKNE